MAVKNFDNTVSVYDAKIIKGKGAVLYGPGGKKYIDFLAGVAVNVLGHNDPSVTRAACAQVKKYIHSSRLFFNPEQEKLAKQLCAASFGSGVYFINSGAEATEVAVKIARKWGAVRKKGAYKIISMKNSFHGRTIAALAATGQKKFHKYLKPLPSGFKHARFNDIESVKKMIDKKTAAVLIEPVQAEGGVYAAEKIYMKKLAALCAARKVLLIVDEVQTGMGRTGYVFAYRGYGIKPDIMTTGKGLGGGFPLSAVVVSEKIKKILEIGDHGTTMGGNPVACAAGNAVFAKIKLPVFLKSVKEKGDYLMKELKAMNSPLVKDVRGKGLIVGLQVKGNAADVVKKSLSRGLVINAPKPDVIRIVPPLIISKKEIKTGVDILKRVLEDESLKRGNEK